MPVDGDYKMITLEHQNYILSLTRKLISSCLDEAGFDPTVKEPGHSYGEKVEEILVNKFVGIDVRFSSPSKTKGRGKQTRKMEDFLFLQNLVNVKLGYEKGKGQPNMVSFNRLVKKYLSGEIDSYYVLIIDVRGTTKENLTTQEYLFDLFDYLDYVNYNYGTGQVMLKESQFFADYDSNTYIHKTKKEIVEQLMEIDEKAYQSHIKLKKQQHKKKQEEFNEYLQALQ
tara:strand:- start:1012 stop:1692 length:681 start_codon:yes stop_codon:yes gene_type:complete